jgi:peptidoglycan/xylan/chitin deacetylase (PgdA/CDA1 family)
MYHRVADVPCDPWDQCVTPDHFDQQLKILQESFQVLSLAQVSCALERQQLPRRAVALTFDDGYADNLFSAKPLLDQHNVPATVFLSTGALGARREFWWDELERIFLHPGELPAELHLRSTTGSRRWLLGAEALYTRETWDCHRSWRAWSPPQTTRQRVYYEVWDWLRPLSPSLREELLEQLAAWARKPREARPSHRSLTLPEASRLATGGLVSLGAHTVSHSALSTQPRQVQEQEIRQSKATIETQLGLKAHHFAYPYGDYSPQAVAVVRESGFTAAFTTDEATVRRGAAAWQLPRCKVYDWDGEEFARHLTRIFAVA